MASIKRNCSGTTLCLVLLVKSWKRFATVLVTTSSAQAIFTRVSEVVRLSVVTIEYQTQIVILEGEKF